MSSVKNGLALVGVGFILMRIAILVTPTLPSLLPLASPNNRVFLETLKV
ncbi:hypothetical protein PN499_23160 [Kamptonema animale CS-326]|nr:hypothetical protein [Kamptonema animale CS-326]